MKTKAVHLELSEKLVKDLDKYVDGTLFRSRVHLVGTILTEWIRRRNTEPLKDIKKAKR